MANQIEFATCDSVADRIFDHEDISEFPEFFDENSGFRSELSGRWCVIMWPEHAITRQHLGDATIHLSWDSEESARKDWQ